jgi:hypothetical protein
LSILLLNRAHVGEVQWDAVHYPAGTATPDPPRFSASTGQG